MSIRTKCALLILAFVAVLCGTLFVTVGYIEAYFDDAAATFSATHIGLGELSRLRSRLRDQLLHLTSYGDTTASAAQVVQLNQEIESAQASLLAVIDEWPAFSSDQRNRLTRLLDDRASRTRAFLSGQQADEAMRRAPDDAAGPTAPRVFDPRAHLALDAFLGEMESRFLTDAADRVDNALSRQKRATLILWINAVVGVALGIAGLFLVRRWVLNPIESLERTADELGRGNLEHRAVIQTDDEFGRLAATINKMSADLARIERRMIQRERLAAMGELISYVAHNIRNPLAGIQASAEASCSSLPADSPVRAHQERIVQAIVRFQSWLRELEHTCSPLALNVRPASLPRLIENVVAVFRPMAERRGVVLETRLDDVNQEVPIDAAHFEHAVAAVVGNAIEAAGDQGRVLVDAEQNGDPDHWRLAVRDTGPGIAPDLADRVFEPTYSTKRHGHGLGLAMARKIVEMHGGEIYVESRPGAGTAFIFVMPAQPSQGSAHE